MMEAGFLILLITSLGSFFAAFFQKGVNAIILHVIAAMLFFVTAATSVSVDVVAGSSIISYSGYGALGLVSIGFAIASGGLAIAELEEVFA